MFPVFVPFHSYARVNVAPIGVARLSVAPVNFRPMKCRYTNQSVTQSVSSQSATFKNLI